MANIYLQIEEFFNSNIFKFLAIIPASHHEVSINNVYETGETEIYLTFYGGHLLLPECYNIRVSYLDLKGVIKPDGKIDVMYLQCLFDILLSMAKQHRRNLK